MITVPFRHNQWIAVRRSQLTAHRKARPGAVCCQFLNCAGQLSRRQGLMAFTSLYKDGEIITCVEMLCKQEVPAAAHFNFADCTSFSLA